MTFPIPPSLQRSLDSTKVEYSRLGNSGLQVSWPILGAMSFGKSDVVPWLLNEEEAHKVLKAAYDCGINTWDTANTYSNGLSEEIIGRFLKKYNIPRQKVVIMTKCGFHVGEVLDIFGAAFRKEMSASKDYVNQGGKDISPSYGLTRSSIFKAVDDSLARLGTTYIDLLQIQRYDDINPLEETMKALHDLVQAGKVRYLGASSMWVTQFAELQFIAEKNGWTKFISMQNYYNLCYREEEREMNRFCNKTGVGLIPWSPLYAGRLARPVGYDGPVRSKRPSFHHPSISEVDEEIISRVEQVATKKGWKMSEVALVWHKSKGSIPIVGFNSVERIEEATGLRDKILTEEEIKFLEEPYVTRPIAGHS